MKKKEEAQAIEALLKLLEKVGEKCKTIVSDYNSVPIGGKALALSQIHNLIVAREKTKKSKCANCMFLMALVHYGLPIHAAMIIAEATDNLTGFLTALEMREDALHYFNSQMKI